ncbi:hypothetical protein Nwi_0948 [Nitrobacter winogradskyi Nb-255]|uniref:Uncharacterized protein n=1 Tax=Nitrobacter winogradskyi (strain ATCC 25391 / DSM 10237 / CIP 104748 / NCIMB 11846 / Nb-255) TaxID=323098 RepID=Q3SU31_NITWN|nr:hypothetical protein Nwi_0948 [Nitrobacter winogradskyi Nb-255]
MGLPFVMRSRCRRSAFLSTPSPGRLVLPEQLDPFLQFPSIEIRHGRNHVDAERLKTVQLKGPSPLFFVAATRLRRWYPR